MCRVVVVAASLLSAIITQADVPKSLLDYIQKHIDLLVLFESGVLDLDVFWVWRRESRWCCYELCCWWLTETWTYVCVPCSSCTCAGVLCCNNKETQWFLLFFLFFLRHRSVKINELYLFFSSLKFCQKSNTDLSNLMSLVLMFLGSLWFQSLVGLSLFFSACLLEHFDHWVHSWCHLMQPYARLQTISPKKAMLNHSSTTIPRPPPPCRGALDCCSLPLLFWSGWECRPG